MAINSAIIPTKENSELRTANQWRKQKQQYRRRYIVQGVALQAQQRQFLVHGIENGKGLINGRRRLYNNVRRQCTVTVI